MSASVCEYVQRATSSNPSMFGFMAKLNHLLVRSNRNEGVNSFAVTSLTYQKVLRASELLPGSDIHFVHRFCFQWS